jgi:hypothetical protein
LVVGIYFVPVFGFKDPRFMTYAFGLAMLLFIGFLFGLAGHYDMYNNKSGRSSCYFPYQEKIVVVIIAVLAITYIIIAEYSSPSPPHYR